ncbi:hypothetical protein ACQP2K_02405 [Microbispora siamensis]
MTMWLASKRSRERAASSVHRSASPRTAASHALGPVGLARVGGGDGGLGQPPRLERVVLGQFGGPLQRRAGPGVAVALPGAPRDLLQRQRRRLVGAGGGGGQVPGPPVRLMLEQPRQDRVDLQRRS